MNESLLPRSENEIAAAAAAKGLSIPDACLAGVLANLSLLDTHAERLRSRIVNQGGGDKA